jgi:hypothetical protein
MMPAQSRSSVPGPRSTAPQGQSQQISPGNQANQISPADQEKVRANNPFNMAFIYFGFRIFFLPKGCIDNASFTVERRADSHVATRTAPKHFNS